jgi:hypothetical protein
VNAGNILCLPLSAQVISRKGSYMTKEGYARLTLILSLIAAALALSAALVEYVRRGQVNISLIAAGFLLLALGLGAKGRIAR